MPFDVARRVWPSVCLVLAVSLVLIAAPQTRARGPVSLLVTVVAPAQAPVTDLTAKDFTVQDGTHQIDVEAAEHATAPLAIVLIVENTQREESAAPRTQVLRTSLHAFVNTIRAGTADPQIGCRDAVPRGSFGRQDYASVGPNRLYGGPEPGPPGSWGAR